MSNSSLLIVLSIIFFASVILAKIDIHQDGWGWCTNIECNKFCEDQKYNFGTCEWYLLVRSKCLCTNIDI
ncbi:hypothetical protein GCK72_005195 [Caenorhabditis remanei]|uniref:Knottin scorpion toxin-like domain-containing protein n=1 Tax=Caenorhabditis remanei TaxID=31234 RepID=A0A6A5HFV2_CAERE|nr:hypothetical protein GCK72_005195 [Caenorhabditis remanei]KAF1765243.1 hypothetical protein GCK72_005195 [Caenorhabditis remanei]